EQRSGAAEVSATGARAVGAAGSGCCGGAARRRDGSGAGGESKRGNVPAETSKREQRSGAAEVSATGARAVGAAGSGSCDGAARRRDPNGVSGESKRGSVPAETSKREQRSGAAEVSATGARAVRAAGSGCCGGAARR